jgi:dihydroorotate dehydrogenase electron transfer subunit
LSKYFKAKVLDNLPLNSKNNLLSIEPLEPVPEPEPGQFYMIEAGTSYDPLLKRPFSYLRKTPQDIQFLFTIRGRGTSLMREFKKGKVISILGPLGNGFPFPRKGCTPLIVAGGTGIIALFSLIGKLSHKCHVLYGARNKDELLLLHELEKQGNQLLVCTDDCSFGKEGRVDKTLKQFLDEHQSLRASCVIYACGPKPMLQAVSRIAFDAGIKGYVSLEENMGCGFGACLGCSVKTGKGYKRVCKEGPVFAIEEIIW